MAASDEEGSQSDKNDDPHSQHVGKQFSTIHQEIENKLQKNSNYADRVEAVLSGWEHLAGTVRPDGTDIQELAFFLYKWSLRLVLYGEWTGLAQIVKTRLQVTLQKCSRVSTFQVGVLEPLCRTLLPLVNEPWGHPTLKSIFSGTDVSDEEAIEYVQNETWEVIRVRVDTMMESKKCEDLALRILKLCLRCIELKNDTARPEIPLYTDEDHNHFMDLYFGLLYKEDQIAFVREVGELETKGVQMVNRIVKKQEKLKVWKHRLKIGNLGAKALLFVACKKNDNPFFWQAFNEWCDIQQEIKTPEDELQKTIHRLRKEIEMSNNIYTMASILYQKFGECCRALVTELFIQGLTIDMNSREGIRIKSEDKRPKELVELELQMACGYMDLAQVFGNNFCIVRECILTAFSLHPTADRLQALEKYSVVSSDNIIDDTSEQLRAMEVVKEPEAKSYQCKETQNSTKDPPSNQFEGFENENNLHKDSSFTNSYNNSLNSQGSTSAISTSPIRDLNVQSSQDISQCQYPSKSISNSVSSENNPSVISDIESKQTMEYNNKNNTEEKQVPQIYSELCENREPPPEPKEIVYDTGQSQPPGIGLNQPLESSRGQSQPPLEMGLNQTQEPSVIPPSSSEQQVNNCEMTQQPPPVVLNDDTKDSFKKYPSEVKDEIELKDEIEDVEESHSMEKFFMDTEHVNNQMKDENRSSIQSETVFDIMSNPNQILNGEKLGLSKELCDDLAVVLSSPRWQALTWKTPWAELAQICNAYLHDSDSAKNWAKELKYLDLDYSQFKHLPTAELHEFAGIEKGYEQYIKYDYYDQEEPQYSDSDIHRIGMNKMYAESESTDTEIDHAKKRYKGSRSYESDSDSSDNSDVQCIDFEGKRVTAVSYHDRNKRICIDGGTNKLKKDKINELRRFRNNKFELTPKFVPKSSFAPRLSSLNMRPNIALTNPDKKPGDQRQQPLGGRSSQYHSSPWKYAGSLVAPASLPRQQFNRGASNVNTPRSTSVQCYYRAKDGKVHMAPIGKSLMENKTSPVATNTGNSYVRQNPATGEPVIYKTKTNSSVPPVSKPSSFEDSYAKFLLQSQQSSVKQQRGLSGQIITIAPKKMSLDDSLEYLKKQGTSVSFKSQSRGGLPLANAQKNVLNNILSPENTIDAISKNRNRHTIAMPVSNNPPNNPGNLNRVLPKGTTVVRKPKQDGAGPSGISNNVPVSSNMIISPRVVAPQRPTHFSGLVARPSVTLTTAGMRPNITVARPTIASSSSLGATFSHMSSGTVINSINSGGCPTGSNVMRAFRPGVAGVVVTPSLPAPLVAATVVGSVLNSGVNRQSTPVRTQQGITSNGFEPQWELVSAGTSGVESVVKSSTAILQTSNISRVQATTHTTTVATQPGDIRAASMLETLLRDRGPVTCSQSFQPQAAISTASTTITSALPQTLTSVMGLSGSGGTVTLSAGDPTQPLVGTILNSGSNSTSTNNSSGVVVNTSNAVIVSGGQILGNPVICSVASTSSTGETSTSSSSNSSQGVQQVLVPGQLVQVHTSDGTTGLGIVHSASVDLRLPAGTRVIKSSGNNAVRTTSSQQSQQLQPQLTGTVITQPGGRQVNVLHNVKIVQNVQNRQIVRTVVVPHNMAIQGLSGQAAQLKPQLLALSQGSGASTPVSADSVVSALQQQLQVSPSPHQQIVSALGTVRSKLPASTLVQKMVGRNVVGGSLVIRTLRPGTSTSTSTTTIQASNASSDTSTFEEGLGAKLQQQQSTEEESNKDKGAGTVGNAVVTIGRLPQDEGLGERLSHYLKTALVNSSHTQSVGTQTLTTAVKPSAGQLVNQVALNHLRANAVSSNTTINITGTTQTIVGQTTTKTASSSNQQQRSNLVSMPMTPSNAVSSETLEQLREFESVFEKVSGNKSSKQESTSSERSESTGSSTESFPNMTTISSEESMIAAQLLNMANDTPATVIPSTTSSNYVYSVPTTVFDSSGTRLSEGTYITIPSTTQAGTLILVNHSGTNASSAAGLVTVTSGGASHPPTAPSPTLSSASSHSSIASSPSSTSSKGKNQLSKPKVSPTPSTSHTSVVSVPPQSPSPSATTTVVVTTSPKSPQPPKPPTPKPAVVAKPQVEESDETKARIQAILEQYKQDLANTPTPQPAPRNRKNCPPPKSDSKSSKKKSPAKKSEGVGSPAVSEGSLAGGSSPSPSPSSTSEGGIGTICSGNTTGVQTVQYTSQVLPNQGLSPGNDTISDIKPKIEPVSEVISGPQTTASQVLQGVVVSNVKVEGGSLGGNMAGLAGTLGGGRVVQLIRHGGKVTAITTRHPIGKVKTGPQVGAPPNVTIQGRISMNDLMESHIASLLTGGSTLQAPGSTVVSKVMQQPQVGPPQALQQVIVQTSGGQQLLQHVALQQIAPQPSKLLQEQLIKTQLQPQQSQGQQGTGGVIHLLTRAPNTEDILGLATSTQRTLHVSAHSPNSISPSSVVSTTASAAAATTSSVTAVVMSALPPPNQQTPHSIVLPSSPHTPQPPHTPSPAPTSANELPPTPLSFQMGEESNSSDHSGQDSLGGPLPPFFTLTKPFMVQQQQQPAAGPPPSPGGSSRDASTTPSTVVTLQQQQQQQPLPECSPSDSSRRSTPSDSPSAATSPEASSKLPVKSEQHEPSPASVICSSGSNSDSNSDVKARTVKSTSNRSRTGGRFNSEGSRESVRASQQCPSKRLSIIESCPSVGGNSQTSSARLTHYPQDMRSNSLDSLTSDISKFVVSSLICPYKIV